MNLCCQFNSKHFCVRCLRQHCMDCIKESRTQEFRRGYQHVPFAVTKPACLGCGSVGVWKEIKYLKVAHKLTERQRKLPVEEILALLDNLYYSSSPHKKF